MSRRTRRRNRSAAAAPTQERKAIPYGKLSSALVGKRLRLTQDNPTQALAGQTAFLAQTDNESRWRDLDLDRSPLDVLPPAEIAEMLCDLSPEVSLALWQFLRMINPGFEVKAYRVGTAGGKKVIDERAQAALGEWHGRLGDLYGSLDVVINRLYLNAFLRGSFFAELILDNAGRMPVDIATPDARWLRFRQVIDAVRGPVWVPFQWVGGRRIDLDRPTIRQVPIDPLPGRPEGRALATPSFFTVLFTMSLLRDLKRVVSQQGYPRLSIKIALEQLLANVPAAIESDDEATEAWVDSVVAKIGTEYAALEPDDAYVHTDVTEIGGPHGTVDTDSLGAIDGLLKALDRQAVRALKTAPILFGMSEGVSETNGNRQYEMVAAGHKALQHLAEGLLSYLDEIALQVQGIQAKVEWRFAELRAAELVRDQQVQTLRLNNAALAYALGYVSQDEAALMALDKEQADQEEPRIPTAGIKSGGGSGTGAGGAATGAAADAEDGADQASRLLAHSARRQTREPFTPKGAAGELLPVPDEVEVDAATIRAALKRWDETLPAYEGLLDAEVVG